MVIDEETGLAAYMISGGLLGGSTTDPVKIALLVNTIMTIIDLCQAIMVLASALTSLFMSTSIIGAMMGALIGTAFLALAMNQIIALADYYKTEDESQIILDAIIGVTTSLSLFMIQRLAHSLKLLIGGCFAEDTKVLTKEGYKKIQEIKEGEEVESFNEKTGEKGLKKVLSVEVTEAQKLINIKTERAEIKVTPSHPMLKIGNTWVFAGALKVGDKLAGYDGDEVEVKEIEEEPLESSEKVYNLTVEDYHTYVVSEDSVVVHNKCNLTGFKKTGKLTGSREVELVLDNMPELTGTNREKLLSIVQDSDLSSIVNELYRPGTNIGDGGTASALAYEFHRGSSRHLQKAKDRLRQLNNLANSGKLSLSDLDIVDALRMDLENSIKLFN